MDIRHFAPKDVPEIINLFRGTVRNVNRRDYDAAQVEAWAPEEINDSVWREQLARDHTFVMIEDDVIVGFIEMTPGGRVHRLFVHQDYQRQGIASALFARAEKLARQINLAHLDAAVSITAQAFFETHGFATVGRQQVERLGVTLTNFEMIKKL